MERALKISDKETRDIQINKIKKRAILNNKKHEEKLIREIKETYGNDIVIVFGDCGAYHFMINGSQDNNFFNTDNLFEMTKLLRKEFEIYLIDEYKTSLLFHKTGEVGSHPIVEMKKKVGNKFVTYTKELFPVIKCYDSKGELNFINRDFNAVLNILKIVVSLIKTGKKPIEFTRKL